MVCCSHACRCADYPTDAINSCSNVPDMGASVSFSGCLIDNLDSLAAKNMDGYAAGWNDTYAKCTCSSAGEGVSIARPDERVVAHSPKHEDVWWLSDAGFGCLHLSPCPYATH